MKLAVFAFSRQGLMTAERIRTMLAGPGDSCQTYAPERLAGEEILPVSPPLAEFVGPVFRKVDALVFVGACGIAVRGIAAHVRDKRTDPAVLVVDELAQFVIPLLSGHIGGANALAVRLADALGATAAVTTATDVNGKFSVDTWAAGQGLFLDNMRAAKAVSAAILEGPVPLASDFPVVTAFPPGVVPGEEGAVGICVSWQKKQPFASTLLLVPKVIHLGIGCRRGTSPEAIGALTGQVLAENRIHLAAVKAVASIDLKQDEPGLLAFCQERNWPIQFYTASQLKAVEGDFTPSDFVRRTTGVDNVCERAAVLDGGKLVIKKTARDGVTVAVAVEHWEVRFG